MKKYKGLLLVVAGFVLGVAFAYVPTLEAATSKLLGSKVNVVLDVKIADKSIGEGAVINGTTLVPLRVIAEEARMEVLKVDSKEVVLSEPSNDIDVAPNVNASEINERISELNKKIKNAKSVLANKEGALRQIKTSQEYLTNYEKFKDSGSELYSEEYRKVELEKMNNLQKILDDAELNLPLWERELVQLETQLVESKATK